MVKICRDGGIGPDSRSLFNQRDTSPYRRTIKRRNCNDRAGAGQTARPKTPSHCPETTKPAITADHPHNAALNQTRLAVEKRRLPGHQIFVLD
jgi:hypothetical protein